MRKFLLPSLLWLLVWVLLAARHVPTLPPRPAQKPAPWPAPQVFRNLLEMTPKSMCQRQATNPKRLHGPWTLEEIEDRPDLLEHVRLCNGGLGTATLAELATDPKKRIGELRAHPLDELSHPQKLERLQSLLNKLEAQQSPAASELGHWLARHRPQNRHRLVKHLQDPGNKFWPLDLEALVQIQDEHSRSLVASLARHSHPQVRQMRTIARWTLNPTDQRLWEESRKLLTSSSWARRALVTHGPLPLRRKALLQLLDSDPFLRQSDLPVPPDLQSLALEIFQEDQPGRPSNRRRNALHVLLQQPLDSQKRALFRPILAHPEWLSEWPASRLLDKLWNDPEARRWGEWEHLWRTQPELLSSLPMTLTEERKYLSALRELDRLGEYQSWIVRALWRQRLLSPERVVDTLSADPRAKVDLRYVKLKLQLLTELPPEMVNPILKSSRKCMQQSDHRAQELWTTLADNTSLHPVLAEVALQRLAQGHLDPDTLKVLCSNKNNAQSPLLQTMSQGSGAPAGVAAALLKKNALEHPSPVFLTYHLLTHLMLKHQDLPLIQVYRLQEGAPSQLFQAAQAYLEANPKEQAQELVKRRGGRAIHIRKSGYLERAWVHRLTTELLSPGGPTAIYAWQFDENPAVCRVHPAGATLSVKNGQGFLERALTASELDYLQGLRQPEAPTHSDLSGRPGGFFVHLEATQSWSFDVSQMSIDSEAYRHGFVEKLERIAQSPGGKPRYPFLQAQPGGRLLVRRSGGEFSSIYVHQGEVRVEGAPGSTVPWGWHRLRDATACKADPRAVWRLPDGGLSKKAEARLGSWKLVGYLKSGQAFLTRLDSQQFALFDPVRDTLVEQSFTPKFLAWADFAESGLQPGPSGLHWVALPEGDGTRAGLFDLQGLRWVRSQLYPQVNFSSKQMWVDKDLLYLVLDECVFCLPFFPRESVD